MGTIVISYRRDDSRWIALNVYQRLESHYGKSNVFMDIDSIPLGLDFRDDIRETLDRCDVLVALVGPNWMGKDKTKENILDETDWVRIEIEAALSKKIPVIPVLIDRLEMPKPGELPDGLKPFAFRNAARIDTENFHPNMDKVIASIDRHFSKSSEPVPVKSMITVPQNAAIKVHPPSPPIETSTSDPGIVADLSPDFHQAMSGVPG
jgi:TIR domain